MKFSDIPFCESGRMDRPGLGLYLPGGYWLGKKTFEMAWKQVNKGLPAAGGTAKHTARSMCGENFWLDHTFGQQIGFGRCIKYYADQGLLPLTETNKRKKGSRQYARNN